MRLCLLSLFIILSPYFNPTKATTIDKSEINSPVEKYSLPVVDRQVIEEKFRHTHNNLEIIELLNELAIYVVKWEGDYYAADSILNQGIEMAELSYEPDQLINAYANYLLIIDDYHYSDRVKKIIATLKSTGQLQEPADIWKCKMALAKGYELTFQMDDAKDLAYQALTIAIQSEDQAMIAKSHLLLGNIHREMNNNIEAIRNFLDALTISENEHDILLRMDCYNELSNFYNLIKAYDKSINYKLKELNLAENAQNPDSVRIMTLKFDLEVIAFNNRTLNEKQLYNILDFANRNQVEKLKRYSLIAFRNHLIKQNDLAQLYHLYHDEFPDELLYLKENDTTNYYRMQAFFHEYSEQYDSARIYYDLAAERISRSTDKLRKVSFYLRYGDFLMRRDNFVEATDRYLFSYDLSASIPYYEFMLEATEKLEKIYVQQNDFANAYKYMSINRNITDSLQNMNQKEQLQLMELENEETMREQRMEQARDELRRRNNIQYTAITIIIASAFILLVLLGGLNVSPTIIRMVGFLCFILFFEFLILLFDTWIHHLTHGEPWKILGIKILLMCGLLPLHHIIEKRVTHFLIHHDIKLWKKKSLNPETIN
jgi:hypothetical protein